MSELYLKDNQLNSVLESYFIELDEDALLESCMGELILAEKAKLSKEEKEAKKAEKMEQKIKKAKDNIAAAVEGKIRTKSNKYDSFKLEVKNTTKKEIAKLAGKYAAIGVAVGLTGAAIGMGVGANAYGMTAKEVIKTVGGKEVAASVAGSGALGAVVEGIIPVLAYLIEKKKFKDIYSIRLYGIKDNKPKQIGYWIGVKISKSDLASEYRSKIK